MIDLAGQTLGQYRIEALLGSGGMGQVYRGMHRFLERPAAIKVMQASLAADPAFRARFLREAKAAAALKHPNIVEIYEFGEQAGYLYLVMELMTDGSLRTLLRSQAGKPLPLELGLDLVCQAAEGLAAAHAQGIIHRDIKPDNLLLNRLSGQGQGQEKKHYQLKISDFGLARLAEAGGMSTVAGPMGTLAYMSPEQCQSLPLDGRSDLYSLGIVLYEVTTGYLPFQINTLSDAFNKHVHVAPRPPQEVCPSLPPSLQKIILCCLAKKPEERYASAAELASVLQGVWNTLDAYSHTPTGETELQAPEELVPPTVSTLAGTSPVPRVHAVDQSGHTLQVVELQRQGLTIGRQAGNDLVLPSQAISRQHVKVLWDGTQVSVKDLGSSNGTFLDGVRLLPQESQPWQAEQWVRLGPYWLRLEEASPQATRLTTKGVAPTVMVGGSASGQRASGATPVLSSSPRIGMTVTPTTLSLMPGQAAPVQVALTNLGSTVDWFTTTVDGVPHDWVQGTGETTQLNPGMQQTVTFNVTVARNPSNQAGNYPVTIHARSREKPNEAGIVQAHWTVLPFIDDALELMPHKASGRGSATFTVSLRNGGNTPGQYTLSGEDDEQKLAYAFTHNPVALEPGREAGVPLQVNSQRHWFGREQHQPFQVHARPAGSSGPLSTPGEFVNKPLIPNWVFSVIGVVLAAGLVLGLLLSGILGPGKGGSSGTATKTTPTAVTGTTPTPTTAITPTTTITPTPTTAITPTPPTSVSIQWNNWVTMDSATNSAVSATQFGNSLYLFAKGTDNQIYYKTTSDGSNWSDWSKIPSGGTPYSLSATQFGGKLYLFATGPGSQGPVWFTIFDGSNWSSWSSLGGYADEAPYVAQFSGKLYLFAKVSNGSIWVNTFDGSNWSGWRQIPSDRATNVAVSATQFGNSLYLFAKGTDNRVFYKTTSDGSNWSDWSEIPSAGTPYSLSATQFGGKLYLFATGPGSQGQVWFTIFDGSQWSNWSKVTNSVTTNVAPFVTQFVNKLYLFAITNQNQVTFNVANISSS
jgi:serine/threonine protein kinase